MLSYDENQAYCALAAAIIKQAFIDLISGYYSKYTGLYKKPKKIDNVQMFLMSPWFGILSSGINMEIDPYEFDARAREIAEKRAAINGYINNEVLYD